FEQWRRLGRGVFYAEAPVISNYNKKRFLVIDDQPLARDALRTVAQTIGAFAVEFASNYQDAIYRIRNNVPEIILCDYILGDGRSGQQLLEELRRFNLLPDECIKLKRRNSSSNCWPER